MTTLNGITILGAITTNPNHPEGNSQDPRELSIRCIEGFRVTIVAINNLFVFYPLEQLLLTLFYNSVFKTVNNFLSLKES
jgi:hypothetical protein